MTFIQDPTLVKDGEARDEPKDVGIYAGFFQYLFADLSMEHTDNRYERVMKHLKDVFTKHDGYSLRIVGHSMGGALAAIFSFFAAGEEWIPPIECIVFGCPRFGDVSFFHAFRRLELADQISMLRVVNNGDFISSLPDRFHCLQRSTFHHVGLEIRLFEEAPEPVVFMPGQHHSTFWNQLCHDGKKYWRRFKTALCLILQWILTGLAPLTWMLSKHNCTGYADELSKKDKQERLAKMNLQSIKTKLREQSNDKSFRKKSPLLM